MEFCYLFFKYIRGVPKTLNFHRVFEHSTREKDEPTKRSIFRSVSIYKISIKCQVPLSWTRKIEGEKISARVNKSLVEKDWKIWEPLTRRTLDSATRHFIEYTESASTVRALERIILGDRTPSPTCSPVLVELVELSLIATWRADTPL